MPVLTIRESGLEARRRKEMSDYSFMRTGSSEADQSDSENAQALVLAFAENALKSAALYVSHGGRGGITSQDLKRALMIEMFVFTRRPDVLQQIESVKRQVASLEEEDEIPDSDSPKHVDDCFKLSECMCQLCQCMNSIHLHWDIFTPASTIEEILREHINNIRCSP
jgi:hypothetical protein